MKNFNFCFIMLCALALFGIHAIALADWDPPQEPRPEDKWIQLPDLNPTEFDTGIDICVDNTGALGQRTLGDDFRCDSDEPITGVHIWGSWINDILDVRNKGIIKRVHVQFWTDNPTGGYHPPPNEYWFSTPEECVYDEWFDSDKFVERDYLPLPQGRFEWFWDPRQGLIIPTGDQWVTQVNINLSEKPFYQKGGPDNPITYWLVIQVEIDPDIINTSFGWKTRDRYDGHYLDDAVWGTYDGVSWSWTDIEYPEGHTYYPDSVDLSFVLTTGDELDWGDAPDAAGALIYPTLSIHNGANHIIGGPWLGNQIDPDNDKPDAEGNGQPDGNALGDDNNVPDDEDGVQIPVLTQGQNSTITFEVFGGGGNVVGWIDYDASNTWDASEQVVNGYYGNGPQAVNITVPSTAAVGQTFARFRIVSQNVAVPGVDGQAPDGEVEDHKVTIEQAPVDEFDFGDAPELDPSGGPTNYPTTIANSGANHLIVQGVYLGASVDAEPDGQPNTPADGDDKNLVYPGGTPYPPGDEDGVWFTSPITAGQIASLNVTASVAGVLYLWIDFGADGGWAEAIDFVFNGKVLNPGVNNLTFTVPNSAAVGLTYARFRFVTTAVAGLSYAGSASDGEVEDYRIDILEPDPKIKWSQPPVINPNSQYPDCFWGWDEISIYETDLYPIVADDWLCRDYRPVTDIHWWGSYEGYDDDVPPSFGPDLFHIGVWTDIPAGINEPWSHPGDMIWQWIVPRSDLEERPVGCDFHPEFMTGVDTCFHYDFIIPRDEWFYQESQRTIYWLSISAIYPQGIPLAPLWGWKTRPHYYNDDAVRITDPFTPIPGSVFVGGQPIEDEYGNSWDMAYELTAVCDCLGDFDGNGIYQLSDLMSMISVMQSQAIPFADIPNTNPAYHICADWDGNGVWQLSDLMSAISVMQSQAIPFADIPCP